MPSFGGLWSDRRSSDSNMLQKGGSFHRAQRSAQNVGHRQKRSSCYVGGDSSVKTNSTMANSLSTTCETSSSSLASINLTSTAANNRKTRSKRSNAKSSEGLAASTAATFAAVAAIRESSGDISGAVSGMKAVAGSAPASECVAESTYAEKKTKTEKYNKYKHENKKLKKELDSLREELQLLDKLKTENLQLNMLLESMDQGQKASHEENRENGGNFDEGSGSLMDSIYRGQKVATHDGRTEGKRTSDVGNDSSSNCDNNSSEIYLLSTPIVDQKEKDDNISHSSKNSKSSRNSGEESKKSASAAASTSSTNTSKRERRLQSQVKHLATLISQQHEANKKELEEKLAKQEHDLTVLHKKQLQEEIHKMQVRQMTQLEQQQQFYESREKEREAMKEKMEQQPTTTAQDQCKENKQISIEDTKEFQDLLDRRLQEAIDEALCKSEAEIMFFHNNEVESLRYELQQSREVARKERERAEKLGREKRKIEDEYDKIKLRMDRMFFGGWNYSIRGNSNEIPSAPSSAPLPSIVRNQNADDAPADPDVNPADTPSADEIHVADVDKGGMRRVNSYSVAQDSVLGCLSSSAGDASMKEMKEIKEQLSKMTLEKIKAETELASLHDKTKNIHVDMLSEIKALKEERDNLKDEVLRLKSDLSRLKAKKGSLQESGDATGCESIDSSFDSSPKSSNRTCERYRNTINFNDKNGINQSKRTSATSTDPTDDNEQNEIDRSETDTESLLTIIAMLRATVDQSTLEKEVLEQRLIEEQERAQQEIRSFAATLEGVEDLRRSAEVMSRELRKIKVKGYKPRSSDFLTGRSCEDLTAVEEADKEMGNALRAVERHGLCGDGSDSRGVTSNGRASSLLTSETGSDYDEKKPRLSVFQTLKSAIADNLVSESLDIEKRTEKKGIVEEYDDYEDGDCDEGPFSEEKKKKKKSKKRKNKTDRSVLTSFL